MFCGLEVRTEVAEAIVTVEDGLVDLTDVIASLTDSYIPLACTEIMLPQPCGVQCPLLLLPSTAYALYGGLAWRLNAGTTKRNIELLSGKWRRVDSRPAEGLGALEFTCLSINSFS